MFNFYVAIRSTFLSLIIIFKCLYSYRLTRFKCRVIVKQKFIAIPKLIYVRSLRIKNRKEYVF